MVLQFYCNWFCFALVVVWGSHKINCVMKCNKKKKIAWVYLQCFLPSLGLERDKFDNKTVTFEEHIKVEHNMWHYLFFIVLVKVKDSTEYTGPESYVAEMIRVSLASETCTL